MISTVVASPVLEEIFYCGCLQSWLTRRLPWSIELAVSTIAFTAVPGIGPHSYNSVRLVAVALDGLTSGILYQLSGSVLPSTLTHFAHNATTAGTTSTSGPTKARHH